MWKSKMWAECLICCVTEGAEYEYVCVCFLVLKKQWKDNPKTNNSGY